MTFLNGCDSESNNQLVDVSDNQSGAIEESVGLGAADEQTPDQLTPDELTPDELIPGELIPDELTPDELTPDELIPDELTPDELTPDELTPDQLTPDQLWMPQLDSRWQWQLQGVINTFYDVDVYDIDLFDTPALTFQQLQVQGKRVVCYFSAGTFENWRTDAALFPADMIGTPLPDYPSERWLDIRSDSVRQIIRARIELAKQNGCDAVEPDNIDAFTYDSGFPLTAEDQLDFIRWLAASAHEIGLAIGLKNNIDQITQVIDVFDFAVNEQCFEYNECEAYAPFIDAGKPVFHAEYPPLPVSDSQEFVGLCSESARIGLATIIMPILLDDSFRIDCVDVLAAN